MLILQKLSFCFTHHKLPGARSWMDLEADLQEEGRADPWAVPHLKPRHRTGQELQPLLGMKGGGSVPDAPSTTLSIPNFSSFKVGGALQCPGLLTGHCLHTESSSTRQPVLTPDNN